MHPCDLVRADHRAVCRQRHRPPYSGNHGGIEPSLSDSFLSEINQDSADTVTPLWAGSSTVFVISEEHETEIATAKVDNRETEIANTFTARQKVTTGLLQKEREITNLYDFLRSNERYVLSPGVVAKRIVVDSTESDIAFGQPSGASITFHLADGFSGGYYEDKNLGEYEFTSAE